MEREYDEREYSLYKKTRKIFWKSEIKIEDIYD